MIHIEDESERARQIEKLCGDDLDLKKRVVALIEARLHADKGLLAQAVGTWKSDASETQPSKARTLLGTDLQDVRSNRFNSNSIPDSIGPYELIEILGQGGMGVVYRAKQAALVDREIAIKVIREPHPEHVVRFAKEQQAMARLEHPGIARIFDAGQTEDGSQYIAMELVRGIPITDYCRKNQLSLEKRLALLVELCHAVQHAHGKGVVHRDIKPSNVLVAEIDGRPFVKIIDFGIAKFADLDARDATLLTATDQVLGTPLYLAPEQLTQGTKVDARCDLYALGILLYEIVTGATPYTREALFRAGYDGMRDLLLNQDFDRPSERIESNNLSFESDSNPLGSNAERIQKLDLITLKALEPKCENRYQSAAEFSADLKRVIENEAVTARLRFAQRPAGKWIRRNGARIFIAAALIGAIACMPWLVEFSSKAAPENSLGIEDLESETEGNGQPDWQLLAQLQRAISAFKDGDYLDLQKIILATPRLQESQGVVDKDGKGNRGFGGELDLIGLLSGQARAEYVFENSTDFQAAAFSESSGRLLVATNQGKILLYELGEDGNVMAPVRVGEQSGRVDAVAISPDGLRAVTGTNELWFWDLSTLEVTHKGEPQGAGIETIVWSPDGTMVAAGSRYEATWLGTAEGEELARFENHHRHESLLFSPDSRLLYVPTREGIDEYDVSTLESRRTISVSPLQNIRNMCFAGDNGQWLIAAERFTDIALLIDRKSGEALAQLPTKQRYPQQVSVSPNGRWLAFLNTDRSVELLRIARGPAGKPEVRSFMQFPTAGVLEPISDEFRLEFIWLNSQLQFLCLGGGKPAQVWDFGTVNPQEVLSPPMQLVTALPSVDGGINVVSSDPGKLQNRMYRLTGSNSKSVVGERLSDPTGVLSEFSEDGLIASLGRRSVDLFDSTTGAVVANFKLPAEEMEHRLSLSRDGRTLAISNDYQLLVWRTERDWKQSRLMLETDLQAGVFVKLSHDGESVILERDAELVEISSTTGKTIRRYESASLGSGWTASIDDESKYLAVATRTNIGVWDRLDGHLVARFQCDWDCHSLLFASRGEFLLSGQRDGTVRVWHIASNQPLGVLFDPPMRVGKIERLDVVPGRNQIFARSKLDGNICPLVLGF